MDEGVRNVALDAHGHGLSLPDVINAIELPAVCAAMAGEDDGDP